MSDPALVRDALLQLDKTLTIRRLYAPNMAPYQEAMRALVDKLFRAIGEDGITVGLSGRALVCEGLVVLERPDPNESFFFPLYRDGLRELTLTPEIDEDEIARLLGVFEVERLRRLGPDEDLVAYLWRCDLGGVRFAAVDGIGDQEMEEGAQEPARDDYRALVAELMERIRSPAVPVTGQTYAFVLDADVRLAASDLHYDPTTAHRAFGDNPRVFRLTVEQAARLREEVEREDEAGLLERFVDILFAMLLDAEGTVAPTSLVGVLRQLVDALWQAGELASLCGILQRLRHAVESAPAAAAREALRDVLKRFFSRQRLARLFELVGQEQGLGIEDAVLLWDLAGDDVWSEILDYWLTLAEGEIHEEVKRYLRSRIAFAPQLLRATLADRDAARVLGGLALLDQRVERLFEREILELARHEDEGVRLRALAAAARFASTEARDVLWRALEEDGSRRARLFAFRQLASLDRLGLAQHLRELVASPTFAARPLWERKKHVQMLAEVIGEEATEMFSSWLPHRRWLWRRGEEEAAELGLAGLACCGGGGRRQLVALAAGRGRLARAAAAVLATSGEPPALWTAPPTPGEVAAVGADAPAPVEEGGG